MLIEPNPYQPRHPLTDDDVFELSRNIRRVGLLEPLLVRPLPLFVGRAAEPDNRADRAAEPDNRADRGSESDNRVGRAAEPDNNASFQNPKSKIQNSKYQLISGHRRLAAAKQAGLAEVPCIVREAEDIEMLELALIENLQRQNLNPIEEGEGYRNLIKMTGMTRQDVARRVNKSEAVICQRIQLLSLPDYIKDAVVKKELGIQAALEIGRIEDEKRREKLFSRANKLRIEELKATVQKALDKQRVGRKRYEKRSADPVFKDIFKDLEPVKRVYKDIVTFRVTDEAEFIRTLKTVIARYEGIQQARPCERSEANSDDPEGHFEN